MKGKLRYAIRPDDKLRVPVTCTDKEKQVWRDRGYVFEEDSNAEAGRTDSGTDKHK